MNSKGNPECEESSEIIAYTKVVKRDSSISWKNGNVCKLL